MRLVGKCQHGCFDRLSFKKKTCQNRPFPCKYILFSAFLNRRASLQQLLTQLSPCPAKVLPPLLGPLELKLSPSKSQKIQLQTKTVTHGEEPPLYAGGDKSQGEPLGSPRPKERSCSCRVGISSCFPACSFGYSLPCHPPPSMPASCF